MESTVLSGPLGHTQWETEQPFPLGFHTLGTDNRGVPFTNTTGQTGFQDFRNDDQDKTSQQSEDIVYMDKPVDLDNLIDISDFPFRDLELVSIPTSCQSLSQPPVSTSHLVDLPLMDINEGANEMSDCTLSWSFPPKHPAVTGKTSANEGLSLTFKDPLINSDASCSEADLKSLNAPVSPFEAPETVTENPFLLVDLLSEETSCVPSSEITPQGVSEELLTLSQEEQAVLPPSQTWETLSPETGGKGLYSSQVTDLPGTCSSSLQGLPDENLLLNHISTPLEFTKGAVPLLDLAILDCDSSLSPFPLSAGSSSDPSTEEPEVKHLEGDAVTCQTLEQGENESCAVTSSVEPTPLTSEDDVTLGAFTGEQHPEGNEFKELMEDNICSEAKGQGNVAMALDLCLTTDEVCHEETWDLKGQEGFQKERVPDLTAEQREGESLVDTNKSEVSDCHEVASLDLSVQDLESSAPGAGWTHEQAVTISLSKVVVDDSLPMVAAGSTREEDVSPLKAVFDALDQDGDGFVRIEEFMEYAAAYGADQVKDLTKFLDPSGLGVISFEDFHRGISAISNGGPEPQLYSATFSQGDSTGGCPEEYDEQNEVTDSAYLGSESTYSECETFTDEDTGALVPPEMHEEVETDSGIEATLHDPEDAANRFSLNSELHSHQPAMVTMIGGEEEHFEDFGESNTSELLLEGIVEVTEEQVDSPLAKTPEQQVNGSSLLSPSAGKRLSSKKVARHLLQNSSMTLDTMSDLTRDIMELANNDITDKVLLLERRVAELEKESETSVEQHARLRQENLQLVHRANALEEQLKEQELCADEQMQLESRRQKDAMVKMERERGLEVENLQARLQQLDEENSELRSCVPCLRANIERLEEEKRKLQDEIEAMSDRLSDESESRKKMADKLSHERHQNQKEKEATQELIEDLRKQLEHLQLYKLEAEAKRGRTPGAGLQEYQTRTREAELEQEIKRLKQDNRSLKDQNDELNGQIINLSIQGAKNLMSASFSDSLAAEINSVSRTELMEAVHKQEEINYRLQDYIDKIIVAIMECNPSILEVK